MRETLKGFGLLGIIVSVVYGFFVVWSIVQIGNTVSYLGKAPRTSAEERRYAEYAAYKERRQLGLKRLEASGGEADDYPERATDKYYATNNKTLKSFADPFSDANAQEGMWRAAEYLVYISFFQLAVGGFGVFLIYETLKSTNSTLKAAGEATRAAVRAADAAENAEKPYVFVEPVIIFTDQSSKQVVSIEDHSSVMSTDIEVGIRLINAGKSPAVSLLREVTDQQFSDDAEPHWEGFNPRIDFIPASGNRVFRPKNSSPLPLNRHMPRSIRPQIPDNTQPNEGFIYDASTMKPVHSIWIKYCFDDPVSGLPSDIFIYRIRFEFKFNWADELLARKAAFDYKTHIPFFEGTYVKSVDTSVELMRKEAREKQEN